MTSLIFSLFAHLSFYIALLFCALCLATGLYYLSELAEQHSMRTKQVLKYLSYMVIAVHILLLLSGDLPFFAAFVGILSHLIYYQLIYSFPFVQLQSFISILSCVMFVLSHVLWFRHFTNYQTHAYDVYFQFTELIGFFFMMVWLVPGGFLVTLSISDMQLPGSTDHLRGEIKRGGMKGRWNFVKWIGNMLNFGKGKRATQQVPHFE